MGYFWLPSWSRILPSMIFKVPLCWDSHIYSLCEFLWSQPFDGHHSGVEWKCYSKLAPGFFFLHSLVWQDCWFTLSSLIHPPGSLGCVPPHVCHCYSLVMSNGPSSFPPSALSNLFWVSAEQVGMSFRTCGLMKWEVLHYLTAECVFWLLFHLLVCLCLRLEILWKHFQCCNESVI